MIQRSVATTSSSRHRWRALSVAGLIVGLLLVTAACASSDATSEAAPPSTVPVASERASAVVEVMGSSTPLSETQRSCVAERLDADPALLSAVEAPTVDAAST